MKQRWKSWGTGSILTIFVLGACAASGSASRGGTNLQKFNGAAFEANCQGGKITASNVGWCLKSGVPEADKLEVFVVVNGKQQPEPIVRECRVPHGPGVKEFQRQSLSFTLDTQGLDPKKDQVGLKFEVTWKKEGEPDQINYFSVDLKFGD